MRTESRSRIATRGNSVTWQVEGWRVEVGQGPAKADYRTMGVHAEADGISWHTDSLVGRVVWDEVWEQDGYAA